MNQAKRPTAADGEKFSKATQVLPEFGWLTPEEAAAMLEDETGKLTDYGTTAAAIAALEERVRRLAQKKKHLLDLMAANQHADYSEGLRFLNTELAAAVQQLAHYRQQVKQQN